MSYLKYDGSLAAQTAGPASNLYGTSAVETLSGTSAAEGFWGSSGDSLIGGGGDDTFYLQGNGISVSEAAGGGTDKIVAWSNVNLANYANVENLEIGGDKTYGAGNAGDNLIVATGTNQQLYGGGGQDVLVGSSAGADTFIVVKGQGNDAIYNFGPSQDVLRLEGSSYTSFAQVQSHMTQVGSDVKIDLGGTDGVVIRNITTSQLTAANFELPLDHAKLGALTFDDEFNGSQLSIWNAAHNPTGVWRPDYGYAGSQGESSYTLPTNGELQVYTSPYFRDAPGNYAVSPFSEGGGALTISAHVAPAGATDLWGQSYTSGMITTKESFAQTYGYFEMRAELPHTAGGWPAFWLLPADGSWPPELDVMETLTQDPSADFTTAHSNVGDSHTMSQGMSFIPDTVDGFHTYGVLWTAKDLTWYVDGVEVYHSATPADMNKPMYMLANLAVGGWGGSVDASQMPADMQIDYIRAYSLADGSSSVTLDTAHTGGTTPDPTPTPTPAAAADSGLVLTAAGSIAVLTGGGGNDTLTASQGYDTLTGGAGANVFVFGQEPWAPDHITDFKVGQDKLDLSALFKTAGYTGSDPIADHYIYLESDGAGGTLVRFDHDGTGSAQLWPNTIIDLENVSPTGLTWAQLSAAGTPPPTTTTPPPTTDPVTSPPVSGLVLTATGPDAVLTGSAGNDTLNASQGYDTLSGGAGADRFVFGQEPWAPDHITDFKVGTDTLDLSALFKTWGYTGSDPVADKWIYLLSDGSDGTIVRFDHDGPGPAPLWPNTIIDLEHVSPTGLTWAQLTAAAAPGQVLTATGPSSVLTGGAGADTLNASQGYDTLSGGAGADHFVFGQEPWAPDHIANFQVGTDVLDLSALFKTAGYAGSDPIADHYIYFESDGAGGTLVRFDHDGTGSAQLWPNTIIDLEHVSPVDLTWAKLEAGWIAA